MTRTRATALVAICLALGLAGCASTEDGDFLSEALAARGDQPFEGVVRTFEGTFQTIPVRNRVTLLAPNLLRREFELVGAGATLEHVFDGRNFYQIGADGEARRLKQDEAMVLLHHAFDESVFWLDILRNPNMIVEPLPPGNLDGRETDAFQVSHYRGYLRTLHFAPDTRDLLAIEGTAHTAFGRRHQALVYGDYEVVDGRRVPRRMETRIDGEVVIEGTQQFSFDPLPDRSTFAYSVAP